MECGLEKILGKIINCGKCGKWSDIVAVEFSDMIFSINVFETMFSINVLLESLILVVCVICERNKCEDKESRKAPKRIINKKDNRFIFSGKLV